MFSPKPWDHLHRTLVVFVCLALFCTPIVIQVLGVVTSKAGISAYYVGFVLVVNVLSRVMFADLATALVVTLAYAALLGNGVTRA